MTRDTPSQRRKHFLQKKRKENDVKTMAFASVPHPRCEFSSVFAQASTTFVSQARGICRNFPGGISKRRRHLYRTDRNSPNMSILPHSVIAA